MARIEGKTIRLSDAFDGPQEAETLRSPGLLDAIAAVLDVALVGRGFGQGDVRGE
jgi:hypothetical protein